MVWLLQWAKRKKKKDSIRIRFVKTKLWEIKGLFTHETKYPFPSPKPMLQTNKSLPVILL